MECSHSLQGFLECSLEWKSRENAPTHFGVLQNIFTKRKFTLWNIPMKGKGILQNAPTSFGGL